MNDIFYLLDQFQHLMAAPSSSEAQAFSHWLNRHLVGSASGSLADIVMPPGFVRPAREADGCWYDPMPEVPTDACQMEWWQEADDILGIWHHEDSVMSCDHLRFYRLPRTALALHRLARWYLRQTPAVPAPLRSPAQLLAKAFVPDVKMPDTGRLYALLQMEQCYFVLIFRHPERQQEHSLLIDGAPATFLALRDFQQGPEGGRTNEHGHLFFDNAIQALTWFIEYYTLHAWGYLLPLHDGALQTGRHAESTRQRRSPLPDLEKMKRYQAELKADATTQLLSEEDRQEHIAFLMQGVVHIQQAIPPGSIEALTKGIEQLVGDLQAKRQFQPPQNEPPE